ncbi:MAG TPA: glycine/sarcosine/betaine reductase selenoprotein B family protein [Thermoanaerobaculia bacterium]|nr:glycine/sarcosine/betaine reductase selenoprotein B family protein [Thermoanaerobaculia bacterium]
MAEISELSLSLRLFLKAYRWRRIDPVPHTPLRKPLHEAKIALVSTAGLVAPDQPPFDEHVKGGDTSYRELSNDIDVRTLIDTHRSTSYDHAGIESNPNLGFPLDRVRELASDGEIGSLNHRHFSLMGSITAPGRLIVQSAPIVAQSLADDGVDAALLVPV